MRMRTKLCSMKSSDLQMDNYKRQESAEMGIATKRAALAIKGSRSGTDVTAPMNLVKG